MSAAFHPLKIADVRREIDDAVSLRFELPEGANHMPGRRLIRRDGRRPAGKRGRPANIRHQGRR